VAGSKQPGWGWSARGKKIGALPAARAVGKAARRHPRRLAQGPAPARAGSASWRADGARGGAIVLVSTERALSESAESEAHPAHRARAERRRRDEGARRPDAGARSDEARATSDQPSLRQEVRAECELLPIRPIRPPIRRALPWGLGAGERLNSKRNLHKKLAANPDTATETVEVPNVVQEGYLATIRHLIDLNHGHFSARHPDVPSVVDGEAARKRILEAAQNEVFQPGDMIWVEWDTEKKQIVSFGWHYYYRWAYVDTVRRDADAPNGERHGLFPLEKERQKDSDGAPTELSCVRRLFGYTGDNEGSQGIGMGDYSQLMGRVSINAALEVVGDDESDEQRFLPPTFLKELGMPRPSAVEFYLKQPYHPNPRPWDQATLVTYGDAAGYDEPGELAGRKFYLDRPDAYTGEPWKDDSPGNRANERSTLALEASKPGRRFRFTLRFRDLDPAELAAVLVALSPNQFKDILGGTHPDGYCTKLGYARPLGWGSVRIEAKQLLLLDEVGDTPTLKPEADLVAWVRQHYQRTATQNEWLAIHRHKHPDAADYPRQNGQIYTFHTNLRAQHSRKRRYRREE